MAALAAILFPASALISLAACAQLTWERSAGVREHNHLVRRCFSSRVVEKMQVMNESNSGQTITPKGFVVNTAQVLLAITSAGSHCEDLQKKKATSDLGRLLLEEVIQSHLLADDKRNPELRDSQERLILDELKLAIIRLYMHMSSWFRTAKTLSIQEKAILSLDTGADTAEAVWDLYIPGRK